MPCVGNVASYVVVRRRERPRTQLDRGRIGAAVFEAFSKDQLYSSDPGGQETRGSLKVTPEQVRLGEERNRKARWKKWGPYLSERQWGTVREDYSPSGDAWNYFTHD